MLQTISVRNALPPESFPAFHWQVIILLMRRNSKWNILVKITSCSSSTSLLIYL